MQNQETISHMERENLHELQLCRNLYLEQYSVRRKEERKVY